ncbi:MAG: HigA family addiction module antitoxin [Nitrospinales bacterium]
MGKLGMAPSHPGEFVRRQVLEPLNLNITRAAEILGVRRATLSFFLNGKASLSPEMALRLEKAFDVKMDFLLRMQALHDAARMHRVEKEFNVERFQPG